MKADADSLQSLEGKYRLEAPAMIIEQMGATLTVSAVGERLYGEANGRKAELIRQNSHTFRAQGFPITLVFVPGADGRVNEVRLNFMGFSEYIARRIE